MSDKEWAATMDNLTGTRKTTEQGSTAKMKRRDVWSGAVVMLVIILAGIVVAACQPAAQPADQSSASQNFGGSGQRPNFQMEPAKELPTTQPAVRGFVVRHDSSSLVVQIGNPTFRPGAGGNQNGGTPRPTPNGTPRARPTFVGGGTEVTVTVSSATQVYQDVTFASLNGQPPTGTIQQKVEASNLDGIAANNIVTVWGERNGDEITAQVIVYSQPRNFQQP